MLRTTSCINKRTGSSEETGHKNQTLRLYTEKIAIVLNQLLFYLDATPRSACDLLMLSATSIDRMRWIVAGAETASEVCSVRVAKDGM